MNKKNITDVIKKFEHNRNHSPADYIELFNTIGYYSTQDRLTCLELVACVKDAIYGEDNWGSYEKAILNHWKNLWIIGDKVTYIAPNGKFEYGIVKSFSPSDESGVFVVYNCANDWENYNNYTAALTPKDKLLEGWVKYVL